MIRVLRTIALSRMSGLQNLALLGICRRHSDVGDRVSAFAQEESQSSVRANLTADRHAVTVGDVVILTLEVTHPAKHAVVIPRLSREWGAFEVLSQSTALYGNQRGWNGDDAPEDRGRAVRSGHV